jgi:ankyrin repeat protein
MKHLMLIIIVGILFMGCGQSQDLSEEPSSKPIVKTSAPRSSNPIEAKRVYSEMQAPSVEKANPKADLDLIDASMKGNIESARQAIAEGADVNALDTRGRAPIQNALHSGNIEAVKLLIDSDANLNVKSANSWTPLYEAVLIGDLETVKLLLENGAQVNAKDQMGGTAMDQVQDKQIIDILQVYGGKTGRELERDGE